jgi:nucleotide-binding universal stress UspA family protein
MNTVIIPLYFSETSLHAARYAAKLLDGQNLNIILYHSYDKPVEAEHAIGALENVKTELTAGHDLKIEVVAFQESNFVDGLEKTARHRHADLIIMGITGKSAIAQVFFGSNTLKMAERKVCPVLIVPETAAFSPIKNVMLTSDFKNTIETTPSGLIKGFLDAFKPQLHVVNVDNEHYISLTENYETEKQELKKMFADYNPEFYFMRLYDVDEAINLFAESRNIDLIIAIQKNHSFIGKLLSSNRTKTLSYHSKMPILVMHE